MDNKLIAIVMALGLLSFLPVMAHGFTTSGEPTQGMVDGPYTTDIWVIANETVAHDASDEDWGDEVGVTELLFTDNAGLTLNGSEVTIEYALLTNGSEVVFNDCDVYLGNLTLVNGTVLTFEDCTVTFTDDNSNVTLLGNETVTTDVGAIDFPTLNILNSTVYGFNISVGDPTIEPLDMMGGFVTYGQAMYNGTYFTVGGDIYADGAEIHGREGWNFSADNITAIPTDITLLNSTWDEPTGLFLALGPVDPENWATLEIEDSVLHNLTIAAYEPSITGSEFTGEYQVSELLGGSDFGEAIPASVVVFGEDVEIIDNYFHDSVVSVMLFAWNNMTALIEDNTFEDVYSGVFVNSDPDEGNDNQSNLDITIQHNVFDDIDVYLEGEAAMLTGSAVYINCNQTDWSTFKFLKNDVRITVNFVIIRNDRNKSYSDNDNTTLVDNEKLPVFNYNNFMEYNSIFTFMTNFTAGDVVVDMTKNWWANATDINDTFEIDFEGAELTDMLNLLTEHYTAVYIYFDEAKGTDWNLSVDVSDRCEYPVEEMEFELVEGWNLISVPFDTSEVNLTELLNNTKVDAIAFRTLNGTYTMFISGLHNNFTAIEDEGWSVIYVWANDDFTLVFNNTESDQIIRYDLEEGWNLLTIIEYGEKDVYDIFGFDGDVIPALAWRKCCGNYTMLLLNTTLVEDLDIAVMNNFTYGQAMFVYAEEDTTVEVQDYAFKDLFEPVVYA